LISEVYLSGNLSSSNSEPLEASAETLTHRKPNNVPFVQDQEPNFSAIEHEDEDDF